MTFSIGDLSREFGVSLRSLRFYEEKGLLNPKRQGTTRIYGRRDRARLKLVLMGKKVGLSLGEIKEMLELYDLKDGQAAQLRTALARFEAQVAELRAQREAIDGAIEELTRTMGVVAGLLRDREAEAARGGRIDAPGGRSASASDNGAGALPRAERAGTR